MKLTCAGTKKSPAYYIQKSVRIGNKTTTKTVELNNLDGITLSVRSEETAC